jgi:hypothetical protein
MMNHFDFKQNIPTVQYLNINNTYRLFSMFTYSKHTDRLVSNN